ncbi:T9SS sorting signal type C domain-containing protein [Flavobacterium aquariorum]|uniref:T9SS sorting signal type C domain-containing protein n=1 Tax=Flavobacterium aquariorum TaxID=2217670 RepID=UPI000F4FC61E|nr:T9SS sorting signal type C domain-containing protein [Flavobacterium aquariorum]
MKKKFFVFLIFIFSPILIFGQSIFQNSINGVNPDESNPYISGQIVDPNIAVSGIGRGTGIYGINSNNRYDARSWRSDALDPNAYFEFTIIPNTDKKIDFISFVYTGQISFNGPTLFAFRSSLDNFASDIGVVTATGSTVSLSDVNFQNVVSPITFRLYGWGAITGTGAFSINDFQFNGVISCADPQIPILPEISLSCSSTSFALNWSASLQASNYFIDVATDSGFMNCLAGYQNKDLGDALSESVHALAVGGIYYVRLRTANGCATSSYSNTIKVAPPETIYNGTWSNGIPDATKNVRFSSNFNVSTILEACSCQIDSGVAVNVDSGAVLKLENGLDVMGGGILTFENNSSLIQENDAAVNTGRIIYKRETTPMKNFDYTYWSSPVQDQVLNVLSPNTLSDKYMSYSMNKWVVEPATNTMNPSGKGFIIRVPKPQFWTNPINPTYIQPVQFEGVPNNGVYTLPIDPTGYSNLIGNPYPSAMSADAFLLENSINNPKLEGTIRFWTHSSAITNLKYSGTDYASYNYLGGVGTSGNFVDANGNGIMDSGEEQIVNKPLGYIAAGQSFFVKSAAGTGSVVFNNGMRVGIAGKNGQFFKGTKSKTIAIEKHRVWLNLTNTEGAFKQMLVGYATGATNGFDSVFDGKSQGSNKYIDFYSINENTNFVIQGRAVPFDKADEVPLGYRTTIEGTFAISIDEVDGVLATQPVFVEDKVTNVIHNLKDGPYSFSTGIGTFNDRFVLRYKDNTPVVTPPVVVEPPVVVDPPVVVVPPVVVTPPVVVEPPLVVDLPIIVTPPVVVGPRIVVMPPVNVDQTVVVTPPVSGLDPTLENPSFDKKDKSIIVSVNDHQIKFNSFNGIIDKVLVFDLRGRLLYEKDNIEKEQFVISDLTPKNQILIVKTVFGNKVSRTDKIIF